MNATTVLLRRRERVKTDMDSLWPIGYGCTDLALWFVLFRRYCNLNLVLFGRKLP
jgi:hypothetical protein